MRFKLRLSDKEREGIFESARAFGLSHAEIIAGAPGVMALVLKTARETAGEIGILVPGHEGALFYPVAVPTLEEFRSSPAASLVEEHLRDLGGVAAGTFVKADVADAAIAGLQGILGSASAAETYGYGLATYLALLAAARAYSGGQLVIRSGKDGRFYPVTLPAGSTGRGR
ncbi:MAG: hypothetical protein HYY17_13265 [Planctomycetes bacterium]|nr:hypothetical protein [Planctomycetota bacterium]